MSRGKLVNNVVIVRLINVIKIRPGVAAAGVALRAFGARIDFLSVSGVYDASPTGLETLRQFNICSHLFRARRAPR